MSVAESNVSARVPRISRWRALAFLISWVAFTAPTTRAAPTSEPAAPAAAPAASLPPVGVSLTRPANPDDYYPAIAKEQNVTGFAIVEVDVDAAGQLVDARVVQVEPADPQFGFAEAALQVARNTGFANTSQQVGNMKFKVRFDLHAAAANTAPPNARSNVRITHLANPDDFYPRGGARGTGRVLVSVTVAPSGKVVDVAVLEVDPPDPSYGFGPAAIRVAMKNRYSNPDPHDSTIKYYVRFTPRR